MIEIIKSNWSATDEEIRAFMIERGIVAMQKLAGQIPERNILEPAVKVEIGEFKKVADFVYPRFVRHSRGPLWIVPFPKGRIRIREIKRSRILMKRKLCKTLRRIVIIKNENTRRVFHHDVFYGMPNVIKFTYSTYHK